MSDTYTIWSLSGSASAIVSSGSLHGTSSSFVFTYFLLWATNFPWQMICRSSLVPRMKRHFFQSGFVFPSAKYLGHYTLLLEPLKSKFTAWIFLATQMLWNWTANFFKGLLVVTNSPALFGTKATLLAVPWIWGTGGSFAAGRIFFQTLHLEWPSVPSFRKQQQQQEKITQQQTWIL